MRFAKEEMFELTSQIRRAAVSVAPCGVSCAPEPESGQPFANCKRSARKDRLDTLIGEANKLIVEGSFLINIR